MISYIIFCVHHITRLSIKGIDTLSHQHNLKRKINFSKRICLYNKTHIFSVFLKYVIPCQQQREIATLFFKKESLIRKERKKGKSLTSPAMNMVAMRALRKGVGSSVTSESSFPTSTTHINPTPTNHIETKNAIINRAGYLFVVVG